MDPKEIEELIARIERLKVKQFKIDASNGKWPIRLAPCNGLSTPKQRCCEESGKGHRRKKVRMLALSSAPQL
jgi:hypothetical protein